VDTTSAQKIKKGAGGAPGLRLVENPDILAEIAGKSGNRPKIVVGFAAETENIVENARAKLSRKKCDLMVANSVAPGASTFGGEDNEVQFIDAHGVEPLPRMSKLDVAAALIRRVAETLANCE
jgi:phosphopantothenoylcysteine decarboxylase/phosphopantothenate--cysteine ligase